MYHLKYRPTIFIPKPGKKDIYERLLKQCENLKIPVMKEVEELEQGLAVQDVIMDAIFGMSFRCYAEVIGREACDFKLSDRHADL